MTFETCPNCGSVLVWVHGLLVCPKRGCARRSPAARDFPRLIDDASGLAGCSPLATPFFGGPPLAGRVNYLPTAPVLIGQSPARNGIFYERWQAGRSEKFRETAW